MMFSAKRSPIAVKTPRGITLQHLDDAVGDGLDPLDLLLRLR